MVFDCRDTFASPYDSDSEQWDEPLKRRCSAAQTEPFKASTSTQTLITIPFCRDPSQPVPILPPDDTEIHQRESFSKPVIYKRPPNLSPQSYYQPPAPWSSGGDDTNILENSAGRRAIYGRGSYGVDKSDLPDPISELQALAKSSRDSREDDDDDDPPFNFQAMLKKTPKNRASMKRHGEGHDEYHDNTRNSPNSRYVTTSYGAPVSRKHIISPNEATSAIVSPTNSIASNNFPPKYEYERNSRDFDDSEFEKRSSQHGRGYVDNKDETETIQLAPGITVEGSVADL